MQLMQAVLAGANAQPHDTGLPQALLQTAEQTQPVVAATGVVTGRTLPAFAQLLGQVLDLADTAADGQPQIKLAEDKSWDEPAMLLAMAQAAALSGVALSVATPNQATPAKPVAGLQSAQQQESNGAVTAAPVTLSAAQTALTPAFAQVPANAAVNPEVVQAVQQSEPIDQGLAQPQVAVQPLVAVQRQVVTQPLPAAQPQVVVQPQVVSQSQETADILAQVPTVTSVANQPVSASRAIVGAATGFRQPMAQEATEVMGQPGVASPRVSSQLQAEGPNIGMTPNPGQPMATPVSLLGSVVSTHMRTITEALVPTSATAASVAKAESQQLTAYPVVDHMLQQAAVPLTNQLSATTNSLKVVPLEDTPATHVTPNAGESPAPASAAFAPIVAEEIGVPAETLPDSPNAVPTVAATLGTESSVASVPVVANAPSENNSPVVAIAALEVANVEVTNVEVANVVAETGPPVAAPVQAPRGAVVSGDHQPVLTAHTTVTVIEPMVPPVGGKPVEDAQVSNKPTELESGNTLVTTPGKSVATRIAVAPVSGGSHGAAVTSNESDTQKVVASADMQAVMMGVHQPKQPAILANAPDIEPRLVEQGPEQQWTRLAEQVHQAVTRSADGTAHMRISVQPESLGEVHLEVALRENQLTARFTTASEGARQLIETGLPQLQQRLQSEGLRLREVALEVVTNHNTMTVAAADVAMSLGTESSTGQGAAGFLPPEFRAPLLAGGGTGGFLSNQYAHGTQTGGEGQQGHSGWRGQMQEQYGYQLGQVNPAHLVSPVRLYQMRGSQAVDLRA